MYSLFEEQIVGESHLLDHYLSYGAESFAEALDYFPEMDSYNIGPTPISICCAAPKRATGIPIIGSLNGVSTGGWVEYARMIQEAGADALELNIYYMATDPAMTGAEVEQMYLDVVHDVKSNISIPLAVKVGPYFSSFANMAMRLSKAGAGGLVDLQPLLSARFRSRTVGCRAQPDAEQRLGVAARRSAGSPFSTVACRSTSP
jgi:dihydroorotate dehydrogenase (fumarate)